MKDRAVQSSRWKGDTEDGRRAARESHRREVAQETQINLDVGGRRPIGGSRATSISGAADASERSRRPN